MYLCINYLGGGTIPDPLRAMEAQSNSAGFLSFYPA